jgi:septal ring factor EnvC (AmiA/AmiB activator)
MAAFVGACLLAGLTATGPATANELKSKLEAVEQDLDKTRAKRVGLDRAARKAASELQAFKRRGIALARKMHRHSAGATALEQRLLELEHQEQLKSEKMTQRKAQLASTLAALQRIARMPAVTLIAIPQSPDKTIRSAILLRAAVPELQRDATALGDDLRTLSALRNRISADKASLADSLQWLNTERKALAALTADKITLLKSMKSAEKTAAQKSAKLSAWAGSLRELLDKLSKRPRESVPETALRRPDLKPPPSAQTAAPRLTLKRPGPKQASIGPVTISRGALPAPGRIVTAFGQKMQNGTFSKGISIITRAAAPVVAPVPGRIVFAGRFRGYGNLVILELSDRGHALISGMSRISAQIGDEVLVGEPLGEMTPSTRAAPKLYFELRKRGRPINPLSSDTARKSKVNG